jgi:hypothetical protein
MHTFESLSVVAELDQKNVLRPLLNCHLPPALLNPYEELTRPKTRTSRALNEAIFLIADPDQRQDLWQEIHALELRRATTNSNHRPQQRRNGTSRWLEWLNTRAAVSESHPAIANASNTSNATISAVGHPIRRDEGYSLQSRHS